MAKDRFNDTRLTSVSAVSSITNPVGLKNIAASQINPATEDKQDSIITELQKKPDNWGTNYVDDYTTSNVTYVGKEKSDGTWWLLKLDESGNFLTITHATISNNPSLATFATAWAARTTATYNIYETAF